MSTTAFIFMVTTYSVVTLVTVYFFWRVLKTPPKKEPDSFSENDNDSR